MININPIALRTAKTLWSFGHSEFNWVKRYLGIYLQTDDSVDNEPLSIENTLWTNTVVASGTALGLVIYTGRENRSVMNTSQPKSKVHVF